MRYLVLGAVLAIGAFVFFRGITWGLPSRGKTDPFLFGQRTPWTGEEVKRLAPARGSGGADVDANPNLDRSRPIRLNETDAQRAEIVRRYRLYTYQPDEMITMMALRQAAEAGGDPRLYQYGGLWIYPVGFLLKLSHRAGLVELRADEAFYLEHPEEFGKFYVVARAYSAAWGLLGAAVVFALARRLFGRGTIWLPAAAALCYTVLPVVVTMAHEAKPHLPGAVLMLLAVIAADGYIRRGRGVDAMVVGGLCGAATGMVLSAAPVFVVVPVMVWLRHWGELKYARTSGRSISHLVFAAACGFAVYFAANPFVAINAIRNPAMLGSNLGNSAAMYSPGLSGLGNALVLARDGAGLPVLAMGILGAIGMAARRLAGRGGDRRAGGLGWLLGLVAVVVFAQFALVAAGKPPEHARFALFVDVALILAAVAPFAGLTQAGTGRVRQIAAGMGLSLVVAGTGFLGYRYTLAFVRDTRDGDSRHRYAVELAREPRTIWLNRDPAPYNCPPVDLWSTGLLLRPADGRLAAGKNNGLTIDPLDRDSAWGSASITWADKRFRLSLVGANQNR